MRTERFAAEVRVLFEEIDTATSAYAKASGVGCPTGCGACCEVPSIETTVLDCLPLALSWIEKGEAEEKLKMLHAFEVSESSGCPLYKSVSPGKGSCTEYQNRMSICRLFGFAAVRDRAGKPSMAACRVMKKDPDMAERLATHTDIAPLFTAYSLKLISIDPSLGTLPLPSLEAMKRALTLAWTEALYRTPDPA